jgi:homocysteine S-methyltransferase
LIKLIKEGFNTGVDHSGSKIGQPTSFFVGCALNLNPPDVEKEIKNLRRKLRAGADFILTQPVYQPEIIPAFLKTYADLHGPLEVPILVGILPLASTRHASFLHHEVPGINIPDFIQNRMSAAGENGAPTGIEIAIELIQQCRPYVQGAYLMPAFNRFDHTSAIIEAVKES